MDHPALAGHFPGMPILPGVVLLDVTLQIIIRDLAINLENCTVNSVKFLSPAQPGDLLSIVHNPLNHGAVRFDISAGARKIATGSVLLNSLS
ncbi:MAG: hypothetical protein ACYCSS_05055 [Sulfuriferula sp.]